MEYEEKNEEVMQNKEKDKGEVQYEEGWGGDGV
jgi:hypothetical protein